MCSNRKGPRDQGTKGPRGGAGLRPVFESPRVHIPARQCQTVETAARLEWLATNGIGGFASGTLAGCLARRYHGLLIAALRPPLGRTLLAAKLDETARAGGGEFALYTNWWAGGIEQPAGCRFLRRFDLVLGVPTWTFEFGGRRLLKRIWMEQGRNTTYVQYELLDEPLESHNGVRAPAFRPGAVELSCRALVNRRDYHALHRGERALDVATLHDGLRIGAEDGAPLQMRCPDAAWQPDRTWYRDFELVIERERGFDHVEDHLCAGECTLALTPGGCSTIVLSTDPDVDLDGVAALERCHAHSRRLLATWRDANPAAAESALPPVRQLVLAADQFIAARPEQPQTKADPGAAASRGRTIIAGYPWFTDWGRDTMISLPGLTLVTGRYDLAREILLTYARYVDRGMIPNRHPDQGETPEYNSVDATLWYFWAASHYVAATGDASILDELLPVLADVVEWFRRGTRYRIHIADDGLVYAGEPGVQLTWMDAKIDDYVVTPRIGKPIELSVLWHDALLTMADFARLTGRPSNGYLASAAATRAGFARFWNAERNCCYDVLDGPGGHESAIRPNQVLAVSIPADRAARAGGTANARRAAPSRDGGNSTPRERSPLKEGSNLAERGLLPRAQQRAVVDLCEHDLAAWFGLRSLAPSELGYRGRYAGDYRERDSAYHQGTAWGWLLGPFAQAHYAVHRDAAAARSLLEPMFGQLYRHGVGSLSEIFDGDEPHRPDGCTAQAWSVAETLRAWHVLSNAG